MNDGLAGASSDDLPEDFDGDLPLDVAEGAALGALHFDSLSSTDFESFCFDLLEISGFQNVDWRKGTPLPSSPTDRVRDIVAHQERSDVDGHRFVEKWFVDCKHYERWCAARGSTRSNYVGELGASFHGALYRIRISYQRRYGLDC